MMTTQTEIGSPDGDGRHVLVVGGSGMLAAFCLSLARRNYNVTVVCRSKNKFDRNIGELSSNSLIPIYVDYRDSEKLGHELARLCCKSGCIDTTVSWIHPEQSVAAFGVTAEYTKAHFYSVLGSSDGKPDEADPVKQTILASNPNLAVYAIALGFILDPVIQSHRWLTNEEISTGVLQAFDERQSHFIVGNLA